MNKIKFVKILNEYEYGRDYHYWVDGIHHHPALCKTCLKKGYKTNPLDKLQIDNILNNDLGRNNT